MADWVQQCQQCLQESGALVIVSVVSVKGSTPREVGTRMLVTEQSIVNTIGGGNLEYQAIRIARNMLDQQTANEYQRFSLAAGLGQCCGGVVTLFFERLSADTDWLNELQRWQSEQIPCMQVIPIERESSLPRLLVSQHSVYPASEDNSRNKPLIQHARSLLQASSPTQLQVVPMEIKIREAVIFDPLEQSDFAIYLFGAGHVGRALVKLLVQQSCQLTWVDTRDDQLPQPEASHIRTVCTDVPEAVIDEAPAGSYFVVMTHDHSLDQRLAEKILRNDNFSYFGLIGSNTKRKRFEHRLRDRGISQQRLQKMVCPIGISGIQSKQPASIAVAVMAELLQVYEQCSKRSQASGLFEQLT